MPTPTWSGWASLSVRREQPSLVVGGVTSDRVIDLLAVLARLDARDGGGDGVAHVIVRLVGGRRTCDDATVGCGVGATCCATVSGELGV